MKTLIAVAIIFLFASIGESATYYGNDGYSRRIRIACEKATMTKTRYSNKINVNRAKQCFYEVEAEHRRQALVDSTIELNYAIIKRLDRNQRW